MSIWFSILGTNPWPQTFNYGFLDRKLFLVVQLFSP